MAPASSAPKITRLTNCRLSLPGHSTPVKQDFYIDSTSGTIIDPQTAFYAYHTSPHLTIDLNNKLVVPGFIDVQINGCFGLDFSVPSPTYASDLSRVKKLLLQTGITSFLPTLTSQAPSVYHSTLPHLRADTQRSPHSGTESLGAHCEGPFISPSKCGIHSPSHLLTPSSLTALRTCYGPSNLDPKIIKLITLAPELDPTSTIIPALTSLGIIHSTGHSAAILPESLSALQQGSTMLTHLYNAMPPFLHRDPGPIGLLTVPTSSLPLGVSRPYFGLIADGIHVDPAAVAFAYRAHPAGCILVTDAMSVLGLEDGEYPWTNGEVFEKVGEKVVLRRTGGVAGSAVTSVREVGNLMRWTGIGVVEAVRTVTENPARMLGVEERKGMLRVGADADLCVLSEVEEEDGAGVRVEEVWKFGERVFVRGDEEREGGGVVRARL